MEITIKVKLDNAAFQENQSELSEIISNQIPHNIESGDSGKLRDSNGNTTGWWEVNDSF